MPSINRRMRVLIVIAGAVSLLLFRDVFLSPPAVASFAVAEEAEEKKELDMLAADWMADWRLKNNWERNSTDDTMVKIVWMYWEQGMDHLESLGGTRSYYASSYQCVKAWQILHQDSDWDVRILDKHKAMELAPTYRRIITDPRFSKAFNPVKASNLLRFELMTLYGGVWVDTSICPFRHLDDYLPEILSYWGFFAPYLAGPYFAADKTGKELDEYKDCHTLNDGSNKNGNFFLNQIHFLIRLVTWTSARTRSIDTWFLAAAKPNHIIFEQWMKAYLDRIEKIMDGRSPLIYPYFVTQCTFTQLRRQNKTVEAVHAGFRQAGLDYKGGHNFWIDSSDDVDDDDDANLDGICVGSKEWGQWKVRKNGDFAKKHCFFVKKQTSGLLKYVLSPDYLQHVETLAMKRSNKRFF